MVAFSWGLIIDDRTCPREIYGCDPLLGTDDRGRVYIPQHGYTMSLASMHHWWKKGLPFDPFVPNQIRSAAKGSISPGSFENVGQGALVPVQKGHSVPVSSNSRD
jgi:hypothetical protein